VTKQVNVAPARLGEDVDDARKQCSRAETGLSRYSLPPMDVPDTNRLQKSAHRPAMSASSTRGIFETAYSDVFSKDNHFLLENPLRISSFRKSQIA